MNNEQEKYPTRKHNRLRGYHYNAFGKYFITICTKERKCRLSRVGEGFPLPQLTSEGLIVKDHIEDLPTLHPYIFVDAYTIMPNHIHLLLAIRDTDGRGNPSPTISHLMGRLKYAITKKINLLYGNKAEKIFQRSFHDHIIRNECDYAKIYSYIINNPAKWKDDCFYCLGAGF